MPRNIHIFVGDKVKTADGIGIVDDINTWRDRIIGMTDPEAVEFCDQCYRNVGPDYRDTWAEVFVMFGSKVKKYLARDITVLEGRDGKG